MADALPVLNPFRPIQSQEEAETAAQTGAVGSFLVAAYSLLHVFIVMTDVDGFVARARAAVDTRQMDPHTAQLALSMIGPGTVKAVATSGVIYAVVFITLGLFQWVRNGRLLSLILMALAAWSLFGNVRALGQASPAATGLPLWFSVVGAGFTAIALCLYVAGYRGGAWLAKNEPT